MASLQPLIDRGMAAQLHAWRTLHHGETTGLGWKMGFSDPTAQQRCGLTTPLTGYLAHKRRVEDGGRLVPVPDMEYLLEAELAIQVGSEVAAGTPAEAAAQQVVAMAAAIELVRKSALVLDMEQVLSGNLFHEAVVLGAPTPYRADINPSGLVTEIEVGGKCVWSGSAGVRLPLSLGEVVSFVADHLTRHGTRLRAGAWVICGAINLPYALRPGQSARVKLEGIGEVSVQLG